MVMQFSVLVFVLAITFIQSIYGLFSGIIMVFCTIVSAAVALGCYESVNDIATKFIHPNYSAAGSLIVLFVVTLLILRVLADNLVRGNVRVPMYVDWAGGGLLGFVTAELCMGILVIGFQMLPFGGRVMMYSLYEKKDDASSTARAEFARNNLWLNPDGFTAGLVSALSSGSLSTGETTLASVYPDLPEWVFFTGNTVQKESYTAPVRDDHGDGNKDLKVSQWWDAKQVEARYRTKTPTQRDKNAAYEAKTFSPSSGMKLIGMRLEMGKLSGDRSDRGNVTHRFRPTMIRLVGAVGDTPKDYTPKVIAGADPQIEGRPRITDLDTNFNVDSSDLKVDAFFEVDQDFKPAFVEYRRFARAAVSPATFAKSAASGALDAGKTPEQAKQTASGQFRFIDSVDTSKSGDREDLPFAMAAQRLTTAPDAQLEGNLFVSGRIFGDVAGLRALNDNSARVEKFKVPENKRILQIAYSPKKAATTAGQVFNYVARNVNQYFAFDDKGERYALSGYYAIVKQGPEDKFELFFTGKAGDEDAGYRNMLDFKEIQTSLLSTDDNAQLGLLFVVPKGRKIVKIENQVGQGVSGLDVQANP